MFEESNLRLIKCDHEVFKLIIDRLKKNVSYMSFYINITINGQTLYDTLILSEMMDGVTKYDLNYTFNT